MTIVALHRRHLLVSGTLVCASGLTGCGSRPIARRYEMGLSLSDAGRRRSTSVVQRFVFQDDGGGIAQPGVARYGPEGRAATIALTSGGVVATVFRGLARSPTFSHPFFDGRYLDTRFWIPLEPLARGLLPGGGAGLDRFQRWLAVLQLPGSSAWVDLLPSEMPLLVNFRDPANVRSAEWVNPEGGGPLSPVTIRIRLTEEPMTRTPVEHDIRWLGDPEQYRAQSHATQINPIALSDMLYPADFERGRMLISPTSERDRYSPADLIFALRT